MNIYLASMPLVAIIGTTVLLPIAVDALPTLPSPATHTPQTPVTQNAGQPVASVVPDQPIQIEITNAGGVPVTSQLTQPPTDARRVTPGNTVTFGTTHTSYLPLPINLLISPEQQDIGLSLYVTVEGNVVKVVVAQARSDVPGSTSMRIAPEGGIYVY